LNLSLNYSESVFNQSLPMTATVPLAIELGIRRAKQATSDSEQRAPMTHIIYNDPDLRYLAYIDAPVHKTHGRDRHSRIGTASERSRGS
jgi:hypothetical protein